MANFFHRIERGHVIWALATLLFILVGGTGVLYWQEALTSGGLIFVVLIAGLLGLVIVLGVAVAQRNGFVDGFLDGRDGVKRWKKKS